MRNTLRFVLTAAFAAVLFGGAALNAGAPADAKVRRYAEKKLVSIFASSPGGGMYNMAAALAPIWDEKINVTASIGPGGSYSNFLALAKGDTNIGFCHQCMHYWAERGEGPFKSKIEGISHISTLFPATVQAFTLAGNKTIASLADLADKRLGLGPQGSALNIFILDYLKTIHDITPKSIMAAGGSVSFMSDSDMSAALADGIIDIGFGLGTYPKTSIQELENSPGIRLVPIGEGLKKYLAINKGWSELAIPAKTYVGQDQPYPTATSWAVMSVANTLDEELVYRMVRSMWENIDEAGKASFEIKEFMKLETATAAMSGAPLHPGAAKYYREIGLIK